MRPNSSHSVMTSCLLSGSSSYLYVSYVLSSALLLLPLCAVILLQRCKRSPAPFSSAPPVSHADCFAWHLVAMEMLGMVGSVLMACSTLGGVSILSLPGYSLLYVTWYGEMLLHLLTCVERHLAAVHPVTYRGLRGERGALIRNVCLASAWLFCAGGTALMVNLELVLFNLCLLLAVLAAVTFCSFSVLCVLTRSGPGEQGATGRRAQRSKQRAFHTIVSILGVLTLRFAGDISYSLMAKFGHATCLVRVVPVWLNLPSQLLLPWLYLQRSK